MIRTEVEALLLVFMLLCVRNTAFRTHAPHPSMARSTRFSTTVSMQVEDQEYRNLATQVLSRFMGKESEKVDALNDIDFEVPKLSRPLDLSSLASKLDAELYENEWFVTGKVNPVYFADTFKFQDPDVKLNGIEEYARGVNKLFDQETSRAQIITTEVNNETPNMITCTWRLSGKVNIGPGLTIKPYIVYTDFTVDPNTGLIVFQEDRFDIPQWDILLSALFPFLVGKITSPPAPPVEPRPVIDSKERGDGPLSFLDKLFER